SGAIKGAPSCTTASARSAWAPPTDTTSEQRSRRRRGSPRVPVFADQLFSRRIGCSGAATGRHRTTALEVGEQFRSAGPRRLGQQFAQRLLQRFALRGRPNLQPLENPVVDIPNYHLPHTDAPIDSDCMMTSTCAKFVEQRLCLFQVGCLKAFREPAVN